MVKDVLSIVALAAAAAMLFTVLTAPKLKPLDRSVCSWVVGCRIA
jgi:hypothetical protein